MLADDALLTLIDELPRPKRQPNLIFAVSRLLGAPEGEYEPWRAWMLDHWPAVRAEAAQRSTQTNEPRRTTALVAALAGITGPIALLELGASAGLCLYPDRYSYQFTDSDTKAVTRLDPTDGPSALLLECDTAGSPPLPESLPNVVWRAGIDLAPLHVGDADHMHWLETLIWPEQHERRARLREAIAIAQADPPLLAAGDLASADAVAELRARAAQAPRDARLVIFHGGTLVYLSTVDRARITQAVLEMDALWVSIEPASVLPDLKNSLSYARDDTSRFVLAVDGRAVGRTGPHGQSLEWL